jgi:hypothetical protein
MSRIPLLLLLSFLTLGGCSQQSGTGGSDGGGGGGGGGIDDDGATPDPSPQPSVGIPDQNSMTLVAETLNVASWGIAGVETQISVFLADQLNNSSTIPDGTIVYFAAEGGAIDPFCETVNGTCSVTWRSQLPVSFNIPPERAVAGRDTILAWTLGTESFSDNNSNGFFDDGDTRLPGSDVGEPFIDKNENGVRDLDEEFVNYPNPGLNTGGTYNGPNGLYSGVNCAHSSLCASDQSVFIFDSVVLTNSTGRVNIFFLDPDLTALESISIAEPVDLDNGGEGRVRFRFLFTDDNGNPPPRGTTITFTTVDAGEIVGSNSYVVGNTNVDMGLTSPWPAGLVFNLIVKEDSGNSDPENGDLLISAGSTQANIRLFDPPN